MIYLSWMMSITSGTMMVNYRHHMDIYIWVNMYPSGIGLSGKSDFKSAK